MRTGEQVQEMGHRYRRSLAPSSLISLFPGSHLGDLRWSSGGMRRRPIGPVHGFSAPRVLVDKSQIHATAGSAQMDPTLVSLRKARPEDVALVRDMLVDGMRESPFWKTVDLYEAHPLAARDVFLQRARALLPHSFLIMYDGQVVGHVALTPPGFNASPSAWEILTNGIWLLPFYHGFGFFRSVLQLVESEAEATQPVLAPYKPYQMLEAFVVAEGWRGRGIGRHVLEHHVLVPENLDTNMVLLTQEEANVRLYERVGFRTVDDRVVHTHNNREFREWFMLRPAAQDHR